MNHMKRRHLPLDDYTGTWSEDFPYEILEIGDESSVPEVPEVCASVHFFRYFNAKFNAWCQRRGFPQFNDPAHNHFPPPPKNT